MRRFLNDTPIRVRLLAFYLIIALALVSFALFSNRVSERAILSKASDQSQRETMLLSRLLDDYFLEAMGYSKLMSIDAGIQDALIEYNADADAHTRIGLRAGLGRIVSYYMDANAFASNAAIYDLDLNLIYAWRGAESNARQMLQDTHIDPDSPPIRPAFTGLSMLGGIPTMVLAKPVIHLDSGRRLGQIILFVHEEDIAEKCVVPSEYESRIDVIDADGNVISSTQKDRLFLRCDVDLSNDEARVVSDVDGRLMLASAAVMPNVGFRIIHMTPLDQLMRESIALNRLLLFFAAGVLSLAVPAWYIISRTVTQPLDSLARAMGVVGERGELSAFVPVASRDEIGRLSDIFNRMVERLHALARQNDDQQRFLRDYEFRLLQSQIKPHFLYNTLETIMSLTQLRMYSGAIDAAASLARFYRLCLSGGADIVPIHDEIALCESYLFIQRYRYIEYLEYFIEADDAIMTYVIPKLTLQPLLENAINHGIKPKCARGEIRLTGRVDGGDVLFTIKDDGVGMSESMIAALMNAEGGFGLPNIDKRLKILFGEQYGVTIDSQHGVGTQVQVRIPARTRE